MTGERTREELGDDALSNDAGLVVLTASPLLRRATKWAISGPK